MAKNRCVKTQFDKEILCAGTMTDLIEILSRAIQGTEPGLSADPTEAFTPIVSYAGYLEEKKFTPRWDGVSTEDQSAGNFTHVAYVPYDQTVYELDINTLFVRITDTRNKLYKLKGIKEYGDYYIQLQLAETGFEDLTAAEG